MIKKVQIAIIGLATILLLAHQFVPHHHHNKGVDTCNTDFGHHHDQRPEIPIEKVYAMHECLCDHNHENQHADCDLAFESIEKQKYAKSLFAVVSIIYFLESPTDQKCIFFFEGESLLKSQYFDTSNPRGPPAFV